MRKVVFVTAFALAGPAASAETLLAISSEPGDPVGQGQSSVITTTDAHFWGNGATAGVSFSVELLDTLTTNWSLTFRTNDYAQSPLVPGVYDRASDGSGDPLNPYMEVKAGPNYCNWAFGKYGSTGRFIVHEYVADGRQVLRLAVDFEQQCAGASARLFGSLRYNSDVPLDARLSVSDATLLEGDSGTRVAEFVVSLSTPVFSPVSFDVRTQSGSALAGSDFLETSGRLTLSPGQTAVRVPVSVLGDTEVEPSEQFSLVVENVDGALPGFTRGSATIVADDPYKTRVVLRSEPGDPILGGKEFSYTQMDAWIVLHGQASISIWGPEWWNLEFAPPEGRPLVRGIYDGATSAVLPSPTSPSMRVSGSESSGCLQGSLGRFVVLDLEHGEAGEVRRLAIDFEMHCVDASASLFGSVRYDSSIGNGAQLLVTSPELYEGDSGSRATNFVVALSTPLQNEVTLRYRTRDGTAVAAADYVATTGTLRLEPGQTSATVPVPVLGDSEVEGDETFSLLLEDVQGAPVAVAEGVATIKEDDPYKTLLSFDSEPGDRIGQGRQFTLTPLDGRITVRQTYPGHSEISVWFEGTARWILDFAAPNDARLVPGVYEAAFRNPPVSGPHIDVSGDGRGCDSASGRFTVHEAVYDVNGDVQRLAIDYEQQCAGYTGRLFGAVRYNSAVPLGVWLSVSSPASRESDGDVYTLDFVVSLTGPLTQPVGFEYRTQDGTALAGADYAASSGRLEIPPGVTAVTVAVPLLGDRTEEADESLSLLLDGVVGVPVAFAPGLGTILNDDPVKTIAVFQSAEGDAVARGRLLEFSPPGAEMKVLEGGSSVRIALHGRGDLWDVDFGTGTEAPLAPGSYDAATKDWSQRRPWLDVRGPWATCVSGRGWFVVHEISRNDWGQVDRLAADFEFHCDGATAALLGWARYNSAVRLPVWAFADTAPTHAEAAGSAPFAIHLTEPVDSDVGVSYATRDGTAMAARDYVATSGTLAIPAGATRAAVEVPILDDTTDEWDESFTLAVTEVQGAVAQIVPAVATLIDDDPEPALSVLDGGGREGDPGRPGVARVPVSLAAASGKTVNATLSTRSGAAEAGTDFLLTSGTVSIPPGETVGTFEVPLVGDLQPEQDETFLVTLDSAENAVVDRNAAVATIEDDEGPYRFYTVAPCRLLDTREGRERLFNYFGLTFIAGGRCGIPATAKSVVLNVTVTQPGSAGYIALAGADSPRPATSVLNFRAGQTRAIGPVIATLGKDASLTLYATIESWAYTHVVVDVTGYYD